ncbi:hypothetical protein ACUUL3_07265 [Thiovibrio sp. JS02]
MRHRIVLLLSVVLFGISGPANAEAPASGDLPSLQLFYSNDVRGETEPCG